MLADFGAARFESPLMSAAGTKVWQAPEVSTGRYDTSCDVYSFGVVLYELLTRSPPDRVPFDVPSSSQFPAAKGCPEGYLRLMFECVNVRPDKRPKVSKVYDRLRKIQVKLESTQPPIARLPSFSRLPTTPSSDEWIWFLQEAKLEDPSTIAHNLFEHQLTIVQLATSTEKDFAQLGLSKIGPRRAVQDYATSLLK